MFEFVQSHDDAARIAEDRITAHLRMGGTTIIHRGSLAVWRGTQTGKITGERVAKLFCLSMRVDFVVPLASLVDVEFPGVA